MRFPILVSAALLVSATAAQGQVVFSDTFDAENGGVGAFNYNTFANWTVSNGAVDLIGNGAFDFYPGNGLYVDLDGTQFDAATFTSTSVNLLPGPYTLSFLLGVNTTGGTFNNFMTVSVGNAYSEQFSDANMGLPPTFATIQRNFVVAIPGPYSIVFDHAGGDNFGLIIDNVTLTRVPEPSCGILLGAASAAIALRRRRCR